MYKVIKHFTDLQDKNHPYNVGDIFPREGLEVKPERLAELAGSGNRQGVPLIKLVEQEAEQEQAAEGEQEAEQEAEKPKRGRKAAEK